MGRRIIMMPPIHRDDDMEMRYIPYHDLGRSDVRTDIMNYGDTRMRYDSPEYNYPRMGGDYYPEMRRERDSRGRYISVRNNYDDTISDAGYMPYIPPIYKNKRSEEYRPMNKIGFAVQGEMDRIPEIQHNYVSDAGYMPMDEMSNRHADHDHGHAEGKGYTPMTKEKAMEWASMLQNEDGTTGPHWSMEQVKQIMAQRGLEYNPVEMFLALNLTYSDLCKEFRKNGINNMDAYIDFAKAFWLDDKDASDDKLSKYYEYVVK